MNKKILWADNLKGLTMLTVVLGHIATPLTNFIFSWHMPAFFFIAGFFIKPERSFSESVTKEAKRLVYPFFIFGALGLIAEVVKRHLFPDFEFAVQDYILVKEIQGLFLWMDFTHMHQYGFVLWFLMALFWGKLILQFLLKVIKNKFVIGIVCLALFFLLANQNFILPFSIDKGLFSLIWLFLGYLYHNYSIKEEKSKLGVYLAVIAVAILVILPLPVTNIATKVAQNPVSSLLYSLSIIVLLTEVFRNFGNRYLNNQFFESWGKSSLAVLVLHTYTNNVGYIIGKKFFNGNWGVNFIISVIMLTVLLLIIKHATKIFKSSRFTHRFQPARAN